MYFNYNKAHISDCPTILKLGGDTLPKQSANKSYQNIMTTLDISQKFRQIWWNFVWNSYFLGNFSGDQSLSLSANTFLNKAKTIEFFLKASNESKTPSFFYNTYFSNHFIWMNNNFSSEKITNFSATASTKKPYISVSANYMSVSDFIYFNVTILYLTTENTTLNIISINFNSNIDLWKFNFETKYFISTSI